MSGRDVDQKKVLIAGAGLSGSSAAISAAREGHEVTIIESRRRDEIIVKGPTSFEALQNLTSSGDALELLSGIGLDLAPEHLYKGARIFGPSGDHIDIQMKRPHGYFIRRGGAGSLDHQLLETAENMGIEIRCGTRVLGAGTNGELTFRGANGIETERADIVIGADGIGTLVGKEITAPLSRRDIAVGIGCHFRGEHGFEPGIAECWLGSGLCPGEYAYVLPTENEVSVVTTMRPHLLNGVKPHRLLKRFMKIPSIKRRLGDASLCNMIKGGVPVTAGGPVGKGRILLVGEAARLTDPMLGFGMMNAILSGKKAGESISSGRPLDSYQRWMEESILPDIRSRLKTRRSILDNIDDRDLDKVVNSMRIISERVEPDLFFDRRTRRKVLLSSFPALIRGGGMRAAAKYLVPFLYSNYSL
ncbi:MAG: NAD(P)/FAD-dependent oxidoreductase [Thermoplasmatota archaeon]